MITKLQKEYLEKRLTAIANKKMDEWNAKNPSPEDPRDGVVIFELISKKKIKPRENIKSTYSWYDFRNYFDFDKIEDEYHKEYRKWSKKKDEAWDKMKEKANLLMDKVIFEGLDLQGALEEIENMKF